jgi:chromate reductase, NAD(P)H dehydrogenase (quinone)
MIMDSHELGTFPLKIVAISGSLRAASINTAVLRAAATLAPAGTEISLYRGLGELPLFNPDIEQQPPRTVQDFRDRLNAADGLLIASPEYAHGVSGPMKNALDWGVGCEAFVHKPVAVFNTSPRATHADASLRETLATMSACLVADASITLPILGSQIDLADIAAHPGLADSLVAALRIFRDYIIKAKADLSSH